MYFCLLIVVFLFGILALWVRRLRLTIPLLYALLVPFLFRDWYYAHEALGNGIFFGLLGLTLLSWTVTLVRKARQH